MPASRSGLIRRTVRPCALGSRSIAALIGSALIGPEALTRPGVPEQRDPQHVVRVLRRVLTGRRDDPAERHPAPPGGSHISPGLGVEPTEEAPLLLAAGGKHADQPLRVRALPIDDRVRTLGEQAPAPRSVEPETHGGERDAPLIADDVAEMAEGRPAAQASWRLEVQAVRRQLADRPREEVGVSVVRLADLRRERRTMREIAALMGRSLSTISRESAGGADAVGRYGPLEAYRRALERRRLHRPSRLWPGTPSRATGSRAGSWRTGARNR